MIEDIIAAAGGEIESRMRLIKLSFLVDYEHFKQFGKQLSNYDWIYHYYGPYSFELMKQLHRLSEAGPIIEGYDDLAGIYYYKLVTDINPEPFVESVVKKYSKFSAGELKEICYKILDEYGVKPGEKIFEKIKNVSSRKHQ